MSVSGGGRVMTTRRLWAKVTLITSGTSGIGTATMRALVAAGAQVTIGAHHGAKGEELTRS